ncbi:uncharacterized protein CDAR_311171 [Caerostris darwini]|uniref:Uncharacterized protein n=1 Tax=Caerostris darwini TaxID=1538125 RepID=A0AAV4WVV5_9ARAC|nr:uncharacterized protein CDAR_311171 [Caerostris darwini]
MEDLHQYNLRQLVELGLRFPEIGAVNFNIIYLILKTIIKQNRLQSLTPNLTRVYESLEDMEEETESESLSSEEGTESGKKVSSEEDWITEEESETDKHVSDEEESEEGASEEEGKQKSKGKKEKSKRKKEKSKVEKEKIKEEKEKGEEKEKEKSEEEKEKSKEEKEKRKKEKVKSKEEKEKRKEEKKRLKLKGKRLKKIIDELESRITDLETTPLSEMERPLSKELSYDSSTSSESFEEDERGREKKGKRKERDEEESSEESEEDKKIGKGVRKEDKEKRRREMKKQKKERRTRGLGKEKFSWHQDRVFQDKLQDLRKGVMDSKKETVADKIWREVKTLKMSNNYVVDKFSQVLQDFDTVMITLEDDVERLKEKVSTLEVYVYSGEYKPIEGKSRSITFTPSESELEAAEAERRQPQFLQGKAEKPSSVGRKAKFAKAVRNMMSMPEEKRAEVTTKEQEGVPESGKVKPSLRKAYEKFIQAARKVQEVKSEEKASAETIGKVESGEVVPMAQLQEKTNLAFRPSRAEVTETGTTSRGAPMRKLRTAVHAITLLQERQKTLQAVKLARAKEKEALRALHHREKDESAGSLEFDEPASEHASLEDMNTAFAAEKAPERITFRVADDRHFNEMKEKIILYIKSRLEEIELTFMDQIQMLVSSILEIQNEEENLRNELQILKNRLTFSEANYTKLEDRVTNNEEKLKMNNLRIEDIVIELDKKANISDAMQGFTKKDLIALEDRMLKMNEIALNDIEDLKKFLKEYTKKVRDEMEDKLSGFDVDLRLEPLAGRLKKTEKAIKDATMKVRVLEYQSMGPIEVKYLHCEDGRRVKPAQRAELSHWTTTKAASSAIVESDNTDNVEKIEADIQKRLEEAIFRDSKRYINRNRPSFKATGT